MVFEYGFSLCLLQDLNQEKRVPGGTLVSSNGSVLVVYVWVGNRRTIEIPVV